MSDMSSGEAELRAKIRLTILGFKSVAKSVEEKAAADMATRCAEELKILLDSPQTGWPTLAAADEAEAQFAEGIAKFEQLRSL